MNIRFRKTIEKFGIETPDGLVKAPESTFKKSTVNRYLQKGDEKWELARTPDTKVTGALKVGSKVTISCTMTAKAITVK
jgi:hypothetical protein